ncbi:hypothetical protein MNBD_BACTEROID01-975, partial [hydrothermal vent metagenome]
QKVNKKVKADGAFDRKLRIVNATQSNSSPENRDRQTGLLTSACPYLLPCFLNQNPRRPANRLSIIDKKIHPPTFPCDPLFLIGCFRFKNSKKNPKGMECNSTGCSVTKPCGTKLIFKQKPCKGGTACRQTTFRTKKCCITNR